MPIKMLAAQIRPFCRLPDLAGSRCRSGFWRFGSDSIVTNRIVGSRRSDCDAAGGWILVVSSLLVVRLAIAASGAALPGHRR
jgi:hypothetical protein